MDRISTLQAEAITTWLYDVAYHCHSEDIRIDNHIAVLMHYYAHGWTSEQAAKDITELNIRRKA